MEAATTNGWEKFANVNFIYDSTQDANCTANNTAVVFDVNQVNSGGQYLARAFFPNDQRANRNVLVDPASFDPAQTGNIPLGNILTHELGHTLGFRHEHIRSDQGRTVQCPEDNNYRGVTAYDVVSTMHYPQCGSPNNTLALSPKDQTGVAMIYGAPTTQKAPVGSILQPMEGQQVRPNFTVEAMVTDADNNISKVELYIDGAIYGAPDTSSPFTFDVTNATLGAHQLTIKATDTTGLSVTTQNLNVTVSNSAPPSGGENGGGENGGTMEEPSPDLSGGCSTGGGSTGALFGLALLGLVLRRRR
jgi:MYXO-CTERM domain-containing protein